MSRTDYPFIDAKAIDIDVALLIIVYILYIMVMLLVVAMVVPIHKPMPYMYQCPVLIPKQYLMLFNKLEECPPA